MNKTQASKEFDKAWFNEDYEGAAYWAGVWRGLHGAMMMPELESRLQDYYHRYEEGFEDYESER